MADEDKGGPDYRLVRLEEGTNIAADLAPDGQTIVMDLLGMLWLVPIDGGIAQPLTDELADATLPAWSPDGRHIAFQSYRDGNFHLYLLDSDGTRLRQLTSGPYDHREPRFSPDGRALAFTSDRDGRYAVYTMDLGSGAVHGWTQDAGEEGTPAWSPDGREMAVAVDGLAIAVVRPDGSRRWVAREVGGGSLHAPFWTPDGRDIGYVRFGKGRGALAAGPTQLVIGDTVVSDPDEDVFPFPGAWLSTHELLYTADGQIRRRDLVSGRTRRVSFEAAVPVPARRVRRGPRVDGTASAGAQPVRGIVSPSLSPDGSRVVFVALGALWVMPLGGTPVRLAGGGCYVADPAWSPDGTRIVYTCDRAGNPDLWVHELATGADTRITDLGYPAVGAAWSRDGERIAFHDHEGALHVLTLAGRSVVQVAPNLWQPGRASWHPDGTMLTLAAGKPYSKRFREGTNQILIVNLVTGELDYYPPAPHRSLTTRGYDGPVWSPDGRYLAFVMSSLLWVVAGDPDGRPVGEPRQVTGEVTDAPSWSGDSTTLLYLHKGKLRLISIAGGTPRTVSMPLTYAPRVVREPLVIHAGRAWDGLSETLHEDVDIVVEGDRIVEVGAHRAGRAALDATGLTALPGLADMHVHVHMKSRFFGTKLGRLFLAFGVTTIRSPGDPAYHAAADRESFAAGTVLGPRYFGTGEGIDGNRVHYTMMRPITTQEELAREMERAEALDYDLVKLYVNLPWSLANSATQAAHRQGRWVTGHYLYPAVLFGADGKEHLAGTNRLGYAQTQSRLGRSYSDVTTLICETGITITPTLQKSTLLIAEDESLVQDPRLTQLYPPWEYTALLKRISLVTDDPAYRAELTRALAANARTAVFIHNNGGTLLAGTDAPIDLPGISLHLNLRALVLHGMTPHDALRTATTDAADALGQAGRLGVLASGAHADLMLVQGDPLRDIKAAADVATVVSHGVPHDVAMLVAASSSD